MSEASCPESQDRLDEQLMLAYCSFWDENWGWNAEMSWLEQ